MKKIISAILAAFMVLSVSTTAFAQTYNDYTEATLTVNLNATNSGTTSPEVTFNFNVTAGAKITAGEPDKVTYVTDSTLADVVGSCPTINASSVKFEAGAAGDATKGKKDVKFALPEYNTVGIYYYTISQDDPKVAGITLDEKSQDIILKVTVIQQEGKVRVAAIHAENSLTDTKLGAITNTYSAGNFALSKTVTGNMGETGRYFDVDVTIVPAADVTNPASITVGTSSGENNPTTITLNKLTTFKIKHGETIDFSNLPYGVQVIVNEHSYSDYKATYLADGAAATPVEGVGVTVDVDRFDNSVDITNDKTVGIDTGVIVDSLPYAVVLALAVAGAVLFVIKRKQALAD